MSYIKDLRLALKFTQQDFADLLGIKRPSLSMAESERRELPYKAMRKLNRIEQDLFFSKREFTIEELVPEVETNHSKSLVLIDKHKKETRNKYDKACEDLEDVEGEYQKAIESLFDIRRLLKLYPDTRSKEHKQLLNAEEAALRQLEENNPYNKYLLQILIKNCKNVID